LLEIVRPDKTPSLPTQEEEIVVPPGEEVVHAPLTCQVIKVLVEAGEEVEIDQTLLIVEAMKMEMPIPSPLGGKVKEVLVKQGQTVDAGTNLLTLTPL
jgi:biotin carboxyl carrier protein